MHFALFTIRYSLFIILSFFAFLSKNLTIRKKLSIIDMLFSINGHFMSICFTKIDVIVKIANKVSIVWTKLI